MAEVHAKEPPATRPEGRWQRRYGVVAVAVVILHPFVGPGLAGVPYLLVSLLAFAAAVLGLRWHRPADPSPWRRLAVGLGLSCLGSLVWYALEIAGRPPEAAHAIFLVAFALCVTAAWHLGRHLTQAERRLTLLDTAIITTGGAIVVWVFVAGPTWAGSPLDGVERVVRTAYPMLSLVVLAALVRLSFGGVARVRAYWLLVAGLAGFLSGDLLYAVTALNGSPAATMSATIRLAGFALVGAAVLDPTMPSLVQQPVRDRVHVGRLRVALLWVASAMAPLTLVVRLGAGAGGELVVIALGSLVLFTLVLLRMWGLLQLLADYVRREHEGRVRALVENADDVIVILDGNGEIAYVSPSCERVWGYDPATVMSDGTTFVADNDLARLRAAIAGMPPDAPGASTALRGQLRHADGTWRRYEATLVDRRFDPGIRGVVITARDVTRRWDLEQQVAHESFHDRLTGLPNRALFVDRVQEALRPRRTEGTFTAVLLLDVDDLKSVNDVLGHERGDDVLHRIGQRVTEVLRPEDTAARLGGDEFGVLLPEMGSLQEVTAVAERVLAAIATTSIDDHAELEVQASLGIATSMSAPTAHDLLRAADTAMYSAKRERRGSFRLFDAALDAEAMQCLQLKMDLRRAVERDELTVHYQPIHELGDERMVGMEALLRWQHPERGTVSPLEFIPLAEESGTIAQLGAFVLRRACRDLATYRAASGRDVFVTVNVSPRQLVDPSLPTVVAQAIADADLPPGVLMLELTENVFLEQSEAMNDAVQRLQEVGVRLAIDDFGTGYCSLGYLNRFRFDVVKIDKSFVDPLADASGDHRLTSGMLDLIGSLEVPAVAEGVETREQLDALRAAGCPFGQGYLWSRPVPLARLLDAAAPVLAARAPVPPSP